MQMRPASAPENFEHGIIRWYVEKTLKGGRIINNTTRQPVDQVCGSEKCFIPKFNWDIGMCKESETSFNNMSVFAFSRSILLMSMWAGNTVSNTKRAKKCIVNFLIFPTPIGLNT